MFGNLIGSLKQIHENTDINYISNIKIEITAFNLTAKDEYDCDIGSHDHCVAQQRLLRKSNCFLPFEQEQPYEGNVCQTYEEGVNVTKELITLRKRCKPSCFQIDVKYIEEPEHYLLALAKPDVVKRFVESNHEEFGYIYQVPKEVRLLSNAHEYTATVALGYFGSIVGVFIGVSILSILEIILDLLHAKEQFQKWILNVAKIGMAIYLLFLFGILLIKFLHYPVANSINFEKTNSNFSISICSLPYAYDINKARTDELLTKVSNFQLSNISFWQKWRNVSTMIDTMTINNGTNDIDIMSNPYINSRSISILPYNNITVAICNTFDLSQHNVVKTVNVVYNTEIEVYFHLKGQLFYEWIRKKTKFLPSSSENVRLVNSGLEIEISDTAAFIAIELQSSVRKLSSPQHFDDCLILEGQKNFVPDLTQCCLKGEFSKECLGIDSLKKLAHFLHNQTSCSFPETVMNVETIKSNYIIKKFIDVSTSNTKSSLREDLGITDKPRKFRPEITLIFPKFTKTSQVI